MQHEQQELLRYYWQELTYLRRMGQLFAQRHPKIAERLELQPDESPDPHVERLIESFAFLTARLQRDIDNDFPEIATEMLGLLHPHYLRPVPSMTVARFDIDEEQGKLTSGFELPRHTPLFTRSTDGHVCRLRTCYPVELWPVEVTEASFESRDRHHCLDSHLEVARVLRLRLEPLADPLDELELERLRFHLHGDRMLVSSLYELLFSSLGGVMISCEQEKKWRLLPAESVLPVGFGAEEEVLPYPRHAQPAYRLLQEYFLFPEKFFFFDLIGLRAIRELGAQGAVDILLLLTSEPKAGPAVTKDNIVLGATPVINLFSQITEPIRVDELRSEYRLVPDARRQKTTEIHHITSVSGSRRFDDRARHYQPFYSFDHAMASDGHRTFWHARRVPSMMPGVSGTDLLLSFVDLDFDPRQPPTSTVYARTICTNRGLAEEIPAGGLLDTDSAAPIKRIVCLRKPTRVIEPPLSGQNLWRLVSHLSLNHLSLTGGEESLKALREILRLYSSSEDATTLHQIAGLYSLSHRPVVRRMGSEAWRGFCRGTEVTLTFDEDLFAGSGAFLLGAVLNRFFGLYCSTNSFSQLVIKKKSSHREEEEWKRWKPMAGRRILQ